jgi:hypothetical protein
MYVSLLYGDWPDNHQFWFVRYRVALTSGTQQPMPGGYASRRAYAHNGRQGKQLQPGGSKGTKTDIGHDLASECRAGGDAEVHGRGVERQNLGTRPRGGLDEGVRARGCMKPLVARHPCNNR